MPTPEQTIKIAKLSQAYALIAIENSGLYGGGIDLKLPEKLYSIRKSIEFFYNLNPADSTLQATSDYLYALCAPFNLKAEYILSIGGGGSISPIVQDANIYPFWVTSSDFNADGVSYTNLKMKSTDRITIFINQYSQQWLVEGADTFQRTSDGFIITIPTFPPFDASTQYWTMLVDKLNS